MTAANLLTTGLLAANLPVAGVLTIVIGLFYYISRPVFTILLIKIEAWR